MNFSPSIVRLSTRVNLRKSLFSFSAVRFGRVPKREKARILAAMQSSRLKTQESKVLAEMTDDGKIIETVVRAHYDTCDYTRNKMEPFLAKARASPSYAVCTGTVSLPFISAHKIQPSPIYSL